MEEHLLTQSIVAAVLIIDAGLILVTVINVVIKRSQVVSIPTKINIIGAGYKSTLTSNLEIGYANN